MTQRDVLAWIVVIVWAAAYVRKITDPSFAVPSELLPVMLGASTYLFGSSVREHIGKRGRPDDD